LKETIYGDLETAKLLPEHIDAVRIEPVPIISVHSAGKDVPDSGFIRRD
jgi:hypothetical protein